MSEQQLMKETEIKLKQMKDEINIIFKKYIPYYESWTMELYRVNGLATISFSSKKVK